MTRPKEYNLIRYLEAKRTVDDRALNQRAWNRLLDEVAALSLRRPLAVIEVGAGVGTMLERLLEWGFRGDLDYTAVDSNPSLLARAAERLSAWARARGWRTEQGRQGGLILDGEKQRVSVEFLAEDIYHIPGRERRLWDLMIAHAFLDLVDLETALACLFSLLRAEGLFYFTLVFDGATILRPALDPAFDAQVEACYHRSMNERSIHGQPGGSSQTGRMLLETLATRDLSIFVAGSSDWVVYPPYPGDEAYFLHHLLHLIEETLREAPNFEPHRLEEWLAVRHRQVEEGRLIYIAHQLDVLGRR